MPTKRNRRFLLVLAIVAAFISGALGGPMFATAFPLCKVNVIELKPPVMLPI